MTDEIRERIRILRQGRDGLARLGEDTTSLDNHIADLEDGTILWRWIENSIRKLRRHAVGDKPVLGPRFLALLDELEAIATSAEAEEFLSTL